jgi:hypothetical protein
MLPAVLKHTARQHNPATVQAGLASRAVSTLLCAGSWPHLSRQQQPKPGCCTTSCPLHGNIQHKQQTDCSHANPHAFAAKLQLTSNGKQHAPCETLKHAVSRKSPPCRTHDPRHQPWCVGRLKETRIFGVCTCLHFFIIAKAALQRASMRHAHATCVVVQLETTQWQEVVDCWCRMHENGHTQGVRQEA